MAIFAPKITISPFIESAESLPTKKLNNMRNLKKLKPIVWTYALNALFCKVSA